MLMPPIWLRMVSNTCLRELICLQPRKPLKFSKKAAVHISLPKLLMLVVLLSPVSRWPKTRLDISGLGKKSTKNYNALWLTSGSNLRKLQRHSDTLVTINLERTQLVSKSLLMLCWRKDKPKKKSAGTDRGYHIECSFYLPEMVTSKSKK